MKTDGCKCTLMSENNNTTGNEGTERSNTRVGERPDPVVPFKNTADYSKRRPWLNAEEELLKRYYCVPFRMSIPWIAQVLKRSEKSVQKKILHMKLRRVGLKNRGLKEWLRQGGSLELPESVVGVTNITEADRRDAKRLEAELKKMWGESSEPNGGGG